LKNFYALRDLFTNGEYAHKYAITKGFGSTRTFFRQKDAYGVRLSTKLFVYEHFALDDVPVASPPFGAGGHLALWFVAAGSVFVY
jgi:hypothetical protein